MSWITGDLIRSLTPAGLLLLIVLLIVLFFLMGWIVPRSVVTQIRQDTDARIKEVLVEKQEWREAHRLSEEARNVDREISRDSLELVRTNESIIQGLRAALSQRGDGSA